MPQHDGETPTRQRPWPSEQARRGDRVQVPGGAIAGEPQRGRVLDGRVAMHYDASLMRVKLRLRAVLKRLRCARGGCGKWFMPTRKWQRFCSAQCRSIAWEDANPRVTL